MAAVGRIPLFQGLNPTQATSVLKVCERKSIDAGTTLCQFGDRSEQMYIFLSGALLVRTSEGIQIARIESVASVGEMGLSTDEPRLATVVATEPCSLFVLGKYKIQGVMRQNKKIEIHASRNVIATLAERIRSSNELTHLGSLIADQGAEPEDLEA